MVRCVPPKELMEGKILIETRPSRGLRWALLLRCAFALACLLVCLPASIEAQVKPSEYDVKAAYLFNFARFVRFAPSSEPRGTFDICILGSDTIGRTLEQITAGETIDKRPVRVMHVPDPTNGRNCAVLFISASERDGLREDLAILTGSDVLTVSDLPDFLERGGMIQFVLEGDHVRFEVNLEAVNRSHLSLSSELLRVAASIKGRPGPGGRR